MTKRQLFVSVIVPNYNHAPYLRQRLDSIYQQTYENFEVCLLDDCSTDHSREILKEYQTRYSNKTQILWNEIKAKSISEQWHKGIQQASGELIWIAESDDWCRNDFLEELVPYFENKAIMLAYCDTILLDQTGKNQVGSIQQYLSDISSEKWNNSFTENSLNLVKNSFGIKNIIPNVSGVLFRNPISSKIFDNEIWRNLQFCGDWVFYLHIIQGGMVAYTTRTKNYFRIHGKNLTTSGFSHDIFYKEHEIVGTFIKKLYNVPDQTLKRLGETTKREWLRHNPKKTTPFTDEQKTNRVKSWIKKLLFFIPNQILAILWDKVKKTVLYAQQIKSNKKFERLYSVDKIKSSVQKHKPSLLLIYSTLEKKHKISPIQLADWLKKNDYEITCLDCSSNQYGKNSEGILYKDIPILNDFSQLKKIITDFGIEIIHLHDVPYEHPIWRKLPNHNCVKIVITSSTEDIDHLQELLSKLNTQIHCFFYTQGQKLNRSQKQKIFYRNKRVLKNHIIKPNNINNISKVFSQYNKTYMKIL